MQLGFFLSSEEHGPGELISFAQAAERSGITAVMISDHFHPWLDEQGQSPFVWSVIGGIAASTKLSVTTGVTCPTVRIHPAIIAQAAATSALLLPGRFRLGVGSGENLNEHILGDAWPPVRTRLEMLEEAVTLMREMWRGGLVSHHGRHYTVANARLYSVPDDPPPVLVSAFGPKAAATAARIGEGLVTTSPAQDVIAEYRRLGGRGSVVAAVKVCWAESRDEAVRTVYRLWRTEGLHGQLAQELPMPLHFAQATELVSEDAVAEAIPCGPEPDAYIAAIGKYRDAGVDELFINQIGKQQDGFLRFMREEIATAVV
ncbi:MAG: TIGR03557 family F420-dependent LLM class oxidoreductase [Candidatus Dormibacteraeota bacterium]|nr:TIGR03557 family F420-dependent LLM class oxidoreductase [Candidatus Dormibacteraeota bacterium]